MLKPLFYSITTFLGLGFSTGFVVEDCGVLVFCFTADGLEFVLTVEGLVETFGFATAGVEVDAG